MNKRYTRLKFSGYLSGGIWFPDEYINSHKLTSDRGSTAQSNINPDYTSPPPQYLKFPRWKGDIDNLRITTLRNHYPMIQNQANNASEEKYNRYLDRECLAYFSCGLKKIEHPGGNERTSIRLVLHDERTVICSYRRSVQRTACEVYVLQKLHQQNAPIPKLLAFNGELLWQEDLGKKRLSTALQSATPRQLERLLSKSLDALIQSHHASERVGLDHAPSILHLGTEHDWLIGLLDRPAIIGDFLGVKAPRPELEALYKLLSTVHKRHIKWDARPGNAMINNDGHVVWFDWEHAGIRNRLDDLIWFLGDETIPELPEVEARILNRYTAKFADGFSQEDARLYIASYGVFHICVRLAIILQDKLDYKTPWKQTSQCIDEDRMGYSWELTQRLCRRGARWASRSPLTQTLAPWFDDLEVRIQEL